MAEIKVTPSEFAQIPLDFVIGAPMMAVINAHKQAAQVTKDFIVALGSETVTFNTTVRDMTAPVTNPPPANPPTKSVEVKAPLLAITKVPNLRVDSMSLVFTYNISQVNHTVDTIGGNANLSFNPPGPLGKLAGIGFSGSITGSRSSDSTGSRNGSLEVRVNMSEAEPPAGLEKIISAMTDFISVAPTTLPNPAPPAGGQG